MREYHPDSWAIIRIQSAEMEKPVFRVAAGWAGGYTQGRSWKLSSSVDSVTFTDNGAVFHNSSGSYYHCNKHREGLDWYTADVVKSYQTEANNVNIAFEQISFVEFKLEWSKLNG